MRDLMLFSLAVLAVLLGSLGSHLLHPVVWRWLDQQLVRRRLPSIERDLRATAELSRVAFLADLERKVEDPAAREAVLRTRDEVARAQIEAQLQQLRVRAGLNPSGAP